MSARFPSFAVTLLVLSGCAPPPVHPTADPRQSQNQSRVEGTVIVQSAKRGNVLLFLYRTDRLPPPRGSGHPVAFTLVSEADLFSTSTGGTGPFAAPFVFSQVSEGSYLVQAVLDHDECLLNAIDGCRTADFNPAFRVTQEPNAGDLGGAALDPATLLPQPVVISSQEDGALNVVTGITVSIGDVAVFPIDRPAFQLGGTLRFVPGTTPQVIDVIPQTLTQTNVDERYAKGFAVQYVDANHDGVPDDADGDGVPDFWPKVLLRKMSDTASSLDDENDADNDGVIDTTGVDYLHADGTQDGQPDAVVLAARLVPNALIAALTDGNGHPRMDSVSVPSLQIALLPAAFDISQSVLKPDPLKSVPSGRYAVTLVSATGQTWRVPNELTPGIAEAVGFDSVVSQAAVVLVP